MISPTIKLIRGDYKLDRDILPLLTSYFDEYYYRRHCSQARISTIDPLTHYMTTGWRNGYNPRADFDTDYYYHRHVKPYFYGVHPLVHYLEFGASRNLDTFDRGRFAEHADPIARMEIEFDAKFYVDRYPDVKSQGIDPFHHYCLFGYLEGRWPNGSFDTAYYRRQYPDVARSGLNPFLHFISVGRKEGRKAADARDTQAARAAPSPGSFDLFVYDTIVEHFDHDFYRRYFWNGNSAPNDLVYHYVTQGYYEGKDPSPSFSTSFYMSEYPDVAESGVNPYFHFLKQGKGEGRQPCPAERSRREVPLGRNTDIVNEQRRFSGPGPSFEEFNPHIASHWEPKTKAIAFYLPQFHAVPENDDWWGEGFTEWRNVARGLPRFAGHYQPRIPRDLGFYALDDVGVMAKQARLARDAGLFGFAFYYYSFNNRRILERPIEQFMASDIDFPFCVVWANENWTRTWDGLEREVLLSQDYKPEDEKEFLRDLARHFEDRRYIRIGGRPLFVVYRPGIIPQSKKTIRRWRRALRTRHSVDPLIFMVQGFDDYDPRVHGLDGAIEFPPHKVGSGLPAINQRLAILDAGFTGHVMDYDAIVARSLSEALAEFPIIKGVTPSWDNDVRRPGRGMVVHGSTPAKYERWLSGIVELSVSRPVYGESFVAINAWNEWAEGAYLEPDVHFGAAYLNSTARALTGTLPPRAAGRMRLLLVGHDAYRHGAQLLLRNLAATLVGQFNVEVRILVFGEGPLIEEYRAIAPTLQVDVSDAEGVKAVLAGVAGDGFRFAIANTTVTGSIVEFLKHHGFVVISLIHELPQLVRNYGLEAAAQAILTHADKVIFPAATVRDRFLEIAGPARAESVIRPQGLYNKAVTRAGRPQREARSPLNVPRNAKLVVTVGYGDHRKGFDLFAEVADRLARRRKDVYFIWVGEIDAQFSGLLDDPRFRALRDRLQVTGFVSNVQDFYAAADVFFLSSREDPFPSVVLEAMAAGLPIVGFAGCGGCDELIAEHGMLLDTLDVDATADAIEALFGSPLRERKIAASRRSALVASGFRFGDYCHDLLRLVDISLAQVSAVVPNYNYERHISERLDGVFAQTYPLYETIVLDDHSPDRSVAVIRECAEKVGREITLLVNEKNSGSVFHQWRKGVEAARGDYVWIAEADDVTDPEFLNRVVDAMVREKAVLGFCDSWQIDSAGNVLGDSYKNYMNQAEAGAFDHSFVVVGREFLRRFLSVKNVILNVSSVVWQRDALVKALERVGDDLSTFKVAGDWRLYAEVCAANRPIVYESGPLNGHRRHPTSVTHALNKARHYSEILSMHSLVDQQIPVDHEITTRRAQHLAQVRRHLGLSDQEAAQVHAQFDDPSNELRA